MSSVYAIEWDIMDERTYETGCDHGVFYEYENNAYKNGVAWNGLTKVDDSPEGGDVTDVYADNIKYMSLTATENLKFNVEAYGYPEEFDAYNGAVKANGVTIRQQQRKMFGFCYRSKIADANNPDRGFKLHLIYGCKAAPTSKSYSTVNENPEAATMSWDFSTTPVSINTKIDGKELKPTACIEISSEDYTSDADKTKLDNLMKILYGTPAVEADPENSIEAVPEVPARMPLPDEVFTILGPSGG